MFSKESRTGREDSLSPRLAPGAVVLIDRHYNSLRQYRRGVPNIYAVRRGDQCLLRQVAVGAGRIILRPYGEQWPVELLEIAIGRGFAHYIVGRACHIAMEI